MTAEAGADSQRVLTVYYDGECKLCLTAVDRLRRSRTRSELRFVPLQAVPAGSLAGVPGASGAPEAEADAGHLSQILVKDETAGKVTGGADAVMLLLRDMPGLAWLGRLGALPGLRLLSAAVYRLVAKYRYRLFGRSDACEDGSCRTIVTDQDGSHGGSR
ncbi:thiol-disulfide oxidoreductase DCC family protein [Cohnella sp. GCM10012308]|uniref:thiol-disulfide oxidoreductase DCC family protein n=1 Tax=Cohnella sp. GCM10012308 TaxID=3317329 RepID=UPI003613E5D2